MPDPTDAQLEAALQAYALQSWNAERAMHGLPADGAKASCNEFAEAGVSYWNDHPSDPHGHFLMAWAQSCAGQGQGAGCCPQSENGTLFIPNAPPGMQFPRPYPGTDRQMYFEQQIDSTYRAWLSEGPGGGHYQNFMHGGSAYMGMFVDLTTGGMLWDVSPSP
jgi:hypothetical protein